MSKHRHDAKHRPDNNELAAHLHVGHNFDNDIEVFVLQSGIMTEPEREFHEDKWICRLQTLSPHGGINSKINQYAKDMYGIYKRTIQDHTSSP